MQSGKKGVVSKGVHNLKFVVDGRSASPAGSNLWTINDHGFALLTGMETRVPRETFRAVPGGDPSSSPGSMQTYYEEIVAAARSVAPAAEHVKVVYHVVRTAGGAEAAFSVQPKKPDSQAHCVVSGMLRNFNFIDFFPEHYKSRAAPQLHAQGPSGVEQFLRESVDAQAMPLSKNQFALMPDASPELKEEVLTLLRDDADYNFVAAARRALPLLTSADPTPSYDVEPKVPGSQAHAAVAKMLSAYNHIVHFPKDYRERSQRQLQDEGSAGVEAFLRELVEGHSMSLDENPHALLPGAGSELQEEVLALLRDDPDYDFVAKSKKAMSWLGGAAGSGAPKKPELQPVALGIHTDVSAQGCLNQFKGAFNSKHPLGSVAPGKKRRILFLKFWRSIDTEQPVQNHHLAMLDKSSFDDSEISELEIIFNGFPIKQYRLDGSSRDKHHWVYFPSMKHDEIICFQQGDMTMHAGVCSESGGKSTPSVTFPRSRQDHATFHTSFVDPTAPTGAPPRESVEAAAFVFFPEEPDVPQSAL